MTNNSDNLTFSDYSDLDIIQLAMAYPSILEMDMYVKRRYIRILTKLLDNI